MDGLITFAKHEFTVGVKSGVFVLGLLISMSLFGQVSKDKLLNNPNHIGGTPTEEQSFETILSNIDNYSVKEVNNAYLNKESSMFMADPDTLMLLFQDHIEYLESKNEMGLMGETLIAQAEILYMTGQMDEALNRYKKGSSHLDPDASEPQVCLFKDG